MALPFAEVIGDPIAQSKSPLIHRHWLHQLRIEGDYVATRVAAKDIGAFLERRRADPAWRGCNVTIPHKQSVIAFLDRLDQGADAIGAVNCVVPGPGGLTGFNTDIDGVAAALGGAPLEGRKAVVIGAGGGARALVAYLAQRGLAQLFILIRDPIKAEALRPLAPGCQVELLPIERCAEAMEGAAAIVNASPLGMDGCPEMPASLLDSITRDGAGATVFDMVYKPVETAFLAAGRAAGGEAVDGLTMLIGQARRAFELFFEEPALSADASLRDLLATLNGHLAGRAKTSPQDG